jgi:predicted nucleotidyltransferase
MSGGASGTRARLGREDIVAALRAALEPCPGALAFWEGGSAAFGRADAWSDLDLYLLAADEAVEEALAVVEQALAALSSIAARRRLPEPIRHGHAQVFYLLADAPEHLVVDLVVLRRSAPERFLEQERHGVPLVYFDRTGEIAPLPLDRAVFAAAAARRLAALRDEFALFQGFVRAEVARADPMAALGAYRAYTLRPLLEVIRMRHCPERYDYGMKYSRADLPDEVVARLERLFYVPDIEGIPERQADAKAWFAEVLAALDREGIRL